MSNNPKSKPRQILWPPWEVHAYEQRQEIIARLGDIAGLLAELLRIANADGKAVTLGLKAGKPEEQK